MRECVCECVCVSKLWMCVQCMCASESGRDRECAYVRVRFSLTSLPSQTFSSLARWRGTSPPLRVLQILSKDGNRRLPSTERPEITLYSPLLVSSNQNSSVRLTHSLCPPLSPRGGEGGRPSCLTPFESPFSPEPRSCLPNLLVPRPMLQRQEPAASLPASNCQALPEPTSRPGLIYKYANLHLFWYANGDMTNS